MKPRPNKRSRANVSRPPKPAAESAAAGPSSIRQLTPRVELITLERVEELRQSAITSRQLSELSRASAIERAIGSTRLCLESAGMLSIRLKNGYELSLVPNDELSVSPSEILCTLFVRLDEALACAEAAWGDVTEEDILELKSESELSPIGPVGGMPHDSAIHFSRLVWHKVLEGLFRSIKGERTEADNYDQRRFQNHYQFLIAEDDCERNEWNELIGRRFNRAASGRVTLDMNPYPLPREITNADSLLERAMIIMRKRHASPQQVARESKTVPLSQIIHYPGTKAGFCSPRQFQRYRKAAEIRPLAKGSRLSAEELNRIASAAEQSGTASRRHHAEKFRELAKCLSV
ncbi:MAG: hypothetical protein JSS51_01390 [Planctomycetes bacterium]|nr:hypothetical protein [Planctomycetota bacterium]